MSRETQRLKLRYCASGVPVQLNPVFHLYTVRDAAIADIKETKQY